MESATFPRNRLAKIDKFFCELKARTRRAVSQSQNGWRRLTSGMEIDELWAQFRSEAGESSRLYREDVEERREAQAPQKSWKQPFQTLGALSWSVLRKLSPARRVLLLCTLLLVVLAAVGFHLFFFTQEIEFLIAFTGVLILLLMVLADHVSMKRDIEIARDIQRWLVPRRAPDIPGIDIAFATRPAKTVGGDYYDAFRRATDGPLLLAVGDVCGKGIPAAMLMATFQASLRALAGGSGSLYELGGGLNRQVCATSQNGRFTTAFLAELNPATGELYYLCAGHNPPFLKREDGSFERLASENIPLGIELNEDYKIRATFLKPGDTLVIFTDGVTEARNELDEEFGEERLVSFLQATGDERSAVTLSKIVKSIDEFVGTAPQHDDITCLIVRRN
jgi:sigma-B regulation protein RsbU (phosphoserine phosphatase)